MKLKNSKALGALLALLIIGCRVQPIETEVDTSPQSPSATASELTNEPTSEATGAVINTRGPSECDDSEDTGNPGDCYAPLRTVPEYTNEPVNILNLHDTCVAGPGNDKTGCVPYHNHSVTALCVAEGQLIQNSDESFSSSLWVGIDIEGYHTNEEATPRYESDNGTPVAFIWEGFLTGVPDLGNCEPL